MARAQITISMPIMLKWWCSGLLSSAGAIWHGMAGILAAKLSVGNGPWSMATLEAQPELVWEGVGLSRLKSWQGLL